MTEIRRRQSHALSGRVVARDGEILDEYGQLIGLVTNGHLDTVIGRKVDNDGFIVDEHGNVLGETKTLIELDVLAYS